MQNRKLFAFFRGNCCDFVFKVDANVGHELEGLIQSSEGIRSLAAAALFFCTVLIVWGSDSQARPCSSSHHRIEYIFNGKKTETLETLAGPHAWREFVTPAHHDGGIRNDGIFRILDPQGSRLIKILGDNAAKLPGGPEQSNPYHFEKSLFGVMLAENIGGPRILRAGIIRNPKTGERDSFIEMEELFAGQKTFTWKGRQSVPDLVEALLTDRPTGNFMDQMGRLFAKTTERKIVVDYDVDFIFSPTEVRWLDTGGWTYSRHSDWNRIMEPIRIFVRNSIPEPWLKELFIESYQRQIELSQTLTLADKTDIKRALDGLVEY